jgi:hypothetical protein
VPLQGPGKSAPSTAHRGGEKRPGGVMGAYSHAARYGLCSASSASCPLPLERS